MNRRAFLSAVSGGLLAVPLAGEAQQAAKVHRLGFLGVAASSDPRFQRPTVCSASLAPGPRFLQGLHAGHSCPSAPRSVIQLPS